MPEKDPLRRAWRSSAAQDQRRAMINRRHETVTIRKQKKEAVLQKKRDLAAAAAAPSPSEHDMSVLTSSLESYLQAPMKVERGTQFKNALSSVASGSGEFLQRLLEEAPPKATALISALHQNLLAPETRGIALDVLLVITSVLSTKQAAGSGDDYYGQTPVSWPDLLVSDEPNSMISTLIQLLKVLQDQSTYTNVLSILGNLVQDSASALKAILPHWPLLVRHLPPASYCCAAIVRQDMTHYGMDFLKDLSVEQIAKLLLDDGTCTEAAWIIEGLSRREDEVVDFLCAYGMISERALISCLIKRLSSPATDKEFLVPALRAICNITTACEGRYVGRMLDHPALVKTVNRLLEERTQIDGITLASCLLIDSGLPDHSSTVTASPNFLPRLVSILVWEHARFEWKRDAAQAIFYGAVSLPPAVAEATSAAQAQSILQTVLMEFVWTNDETHQQKLVQALIGLLKSNDNDAIISALQIMDRLLRTIESSSVIFESCGGVDVLEDSFRSELASQLAADLIDDIFDTDDTEFDNALPPAVENNQFVFGSASQQPALGAFDFGNTVPAGGRGRGRTMPAWMQQQQK